jgi:hypothetical protein
VQLHDLDLERVSTVLLHPNNDPAMRLFGTEKLRDDPIPLGTLPWDHSSQDCRMKRNGRSAYCAMGWKNSFRYGNIGHCARDAVACI